jgi:hypothetical protein
MMKSLQWILILTLLSLSWQAAGSSSKPDSVKIANRDLITLSPLGFVNKVRIKYEHSVAKKLSVGAYGSYYYGLYPGFKLEPFIRLYDHSALNGLYGQFNAGFGWHTHEYTQKFQFDSLNHVSEITKGNVSWFSFGFGISAGYQFLAGKKASIPIDLSVGLEYYSMSDHADKVIPDSQTEGFWYITGPAAVITPRFSVGFTF